MDIEVAKHAGFCFGVKRALNKAYEAATQAESISSYGPLIHNKQAVEELEEKGIKVVDDITQLKTDKIVIRSHGVGPKVIDYLQEINKEVIDATCPFVKVAQRQAKELQEEGYQVVVVGDKSHPEVLGIVGWTNDEAIVIESPEEAKGYEFLPRVGIVAQTTQPIENLESIAEVIKERVEEVKVLNTICSATSERQEATKELATRVDVMLVVGGKHSANTIKLSKICSESGTPTYHIETVDELNLDWLKGKKKIGITAGASTPDWIIEEVVRRMTDLKDLEKEDRTLEAETDMSQADFMAGALEFKDVKRGNLVTGTVVQVSDDEVLVDIGAKSEAVIPIRELSCCVVQTPKEYIKAGDEVQVVVLKVDDNEGRIICSKQKADALKAVDELKEAFEQGSLVKGRVTEVVKGGLLIDLGVRAFMPASHIDTKFVESLDQFVGQELEANIIELDTQKPRVVLSRRKHLEKVQQDQKANLLNDIAPGQVRSGVVRRLTNFGAFVDLGGIDGLLHVSEMAWYRIGHPSEILQEGQEIKVKVLGVENDGQRISLGLKQIQENPWSTVEEKYAVGSIIEGTVVRIAPFGAFVQLEPGVDGLIHLSQLADHHVVKADDVVKVGQPIKAKVIEVKGEDKRISLSLKEVAPSVE